MTGFSWPSRRAVLVIDQDAAYRRALRTVFELGGLGVDEAADAPAGFARFEKLGHDVVVLGMSSPLSDAAALCRAFRRLPLAARAVLVVLADTDDADIIAQALAHGASELMLRSSPLAVLQKRIEHMVLCATARRHGGTSAGAPGVASDAARRRARAFDKFDARYEPRIDAQSYQVVAFEAVPRWTASGRADNPVSSFLSAEERSKFVVELGDHILRKACRDVRTLREEAGSPLRVAVTIAAAHAREPTFLGRVADALEGSHASPEWLELEFAEATLLQQEHRELRTFAALREMGVAITLADFGCSTETFETLGRIPTDAIRLTRSLVRDVVTHPDGACIVQAITAAAQSRGQRVIAEGVDFEEQLNFLTGLGCNELQGPFVGAPLDLGACANWVRGRNLSFECAPSEQPASRPSQRPSLRPTARPAR